MCVLFFDDDLVELTVRTFFYIIHFVLRLQQRHKSDQHSIGCLMWQQGLICFVLSTLRPAWT